MKKTLYLMIAALMAATFGQAAKPMPRKLAKKAAPELAKPVALPATNITSTSFRSNWEPVEGAEGYAVMVYNKTVVAEDGEYTVLDEDFSGITEGSLIEPLGGDEDYVNLDDFDYGDNAGWSAYGFPNFVPSMVAGLLYSPYLNLTNNGGHYKVIITTYSNNGDQIRVESHGRGEKVLKTYNVELPNGAPGLYTKELEFDNGSEDLFFSVINNTAEVASADYTDRIQVVQQLKKGDVYYKLVAIDESIPATYEAGGIDIPVTYKTFTNVTKYAEGHTTLYYNVSAGAYNFYYEGEGEDRQLKYEYKQSPYSDFVKVDLEKKTSEQTDENPSEQGNENPSGPVEEEGKLTLGHFDGTADGEGIFDGKVAYDGANWYNAPMAFTYKNSGSQSIYYPEELKSMKDKLITSISFSCFGSDAYTTSQYASQATLFLTETDDREFHTNPETDNLEWFDVDLTKPVKTENLNLDFFTSTVDGENITITFDLSKNPVKYTGKSLVVTVANNSDQCLDTGEYVRFYWIDRQKDTPNRSCTFVSDNYDFFNNYTRNKRITATEMEVENYNAPAVQFTFIDDDTAAGISEFTPRASENGNLSGAARSNKWYTLQGVSTARPAKGIFINGNKKVVLR